MPLQGVCKAPLPTTTLAADFWIDGVNNDIWNIGTEDIAPGQWTYVAISYDGTDLRAYVNANLDYVRSIPGTINDSATTLMNAAKSCCVSKMLRRPLARLRT